MTASALVDDPLFRLELLQTREYEGQAVLKQHVWVEGCLPLELNLLLVLQLLDEFCIHLLSQGYFTLFD